MRRLADDDTGPNGTLAFRADAVRSCLTRPRGHLSALGRGQLSFATTAARGAADSSDRAVAAAPGATPTFVLLLTPRLFQAAPETRLHGLLLPAYQRDPGLLHKHLPHRAPGELAAAAQRLGWVTYEDCEEFAPGSCRWLTRSDG